MSGQPQTVLIPSNTYRPKDAVQIRFFLYRQSSRRADSAVLPRVLTPHACHNHARSLCESSAWLCAGQGFGADGDEATATAMKALRDEAKVLRDEKAAKKAAFDAEYDVGKQCSQFACC